MTITDVKNLVDLLDVRCGLQPTNDAATNVMNPDEWIKDIYECVNNEEVMKAVREMLRIKSINILERGHVLDASLTEIQEDCRVLEGFGE